MWHFSMFLSIMLYSFACDKGICNKIFSSHELYSEYFSVILEFNSPGFGLKSESGHNVQSLLLKLDLCTDDSYSY